MARWFSIGWRFFICACAINAAALAQAASLAGGVADSSGKAGGPRLAKSARRREEVSQ